MSPNGEVPKPTGETAIRLDPIWRKSNVLIRLTVASRLRGSGTNIESPVGPEVLQPTGFYHSLQELAGARLPGRVEQLGRRAGFQHSPLM